VQYADDPVRAEMLNLNQTWTIRNALMYALTYKALAEVYNDIYHLRGR